MPAGTHQVRMEFAYDGGGLAKGGTVVLYIDGKPIGHGHIDATVPMIYSGDETCDVGCDTGTPVSEDYTGDGSRFTGTVNWVELDSRRRQPGPPHQPRRTHARRHSNPIAGYADDIMTNL